MATPSISIYAELLSNIRQVSLAVSLDSPVSQSTAITVAHVHDSSLVQVCHAGESARLALPERIACPEGYRLPPGRQSAGGRSLTWRLLVVDDGETTARKGEVGAGGVPWEARELVSGGKVLCRKCEACLVKRGAVKEWKDLPAEGWAEMMEFWHCHKPGDEHHHHHSGADEGEDGALSTKADGESLASRGYGAASTITARKGVGFVDLTTFLFSEDDCEGIVFSFSSPKEGSASRDDMMETNPATGSLGVFCNNCETRIGYFNHKTSAVTMFKWQVVCQTSASAPTRPPPTVAECLSATLSATMSRTGSSKSLLLPVAGSTKPPNSPSPASVLHFWILNPALSYTSTCANTTGAIPAMKLLYRTVSSEEAGNMLEDVNADVQEVNLPEEAAGIVAEALDETNGLLPVAERNFREWSVGMLKRWDG